MKKIEKLNKKIKNKMIRDNWAITLVLIVCIN